MDYEYVKITRDQGLAWLTVNREAARNALSVQVLSELINATAELELRDEVATVAITGAGTKAFVAGADIAEMVEMDSLAATRFAEMGSNLAAFIEVSSKPYIAAVNGAALGGGCELALACDFIYASDTAIFGQPEVKLGVIPGFGGTQRLLRRVGIGKAKELVLTGAIVKADEALRIGLVDRVVPGETLREHVTTVADAIAKNGPVAVAEAKHVMHVGQSMSLENALLLEQRAFGGLFATSDQGEGMRAFLDKRAANFEGK